MPPKPPTALEPFLNVAETAATHKYKRRISSAWRAGRSAERLRPFSRAEPSGLRMTEAFLARRPHESESQRNLPQEAMKGSQAVLLKTKDMIVAFALSLFLLGTLLAAWALIEERAWLLGFSVILPISLLAQAEIYRRIQQSFKEREQEYRQLESLFSLFSIIKVQEPMPPMRAWAISPDFANVIVSLIREVRPTTVIEAGSGVSTLIVGYCLRAQGDGWCLSLEHDPEYASICVRNIQRHELENYASVAHAPLKEVTLKGQRWLWYGSEVLEGITSVDLVIVDGPPSNVQKLARYPALPMLFDILTDGAVIVLDDSNRKDEQLIVDRWLQEYPLLTRETIHTEKGTIILRKNLDLAKGETLAAQFLRRGL